MSNTSSIRVQCRMDVRGTAKANADAIEDLGVEDPSPEAAMAEIRKEMKGDGDDEATGTKQEEAPR